MITVAFRTGTLASNMTRDEVTTWLLGTLTADSNLSGLAGFAVSAAVNGMVSNLQASHDTDKVLAVRTRYGTGPRYQVWCTRTGGMFHRVYTFHTERV